MEQLNLFGEEESIVTPSLPGPLDSLEIRERLARFPNLYLGTSSWSFPGWKALVYSDEHTENRLAQSGLRAYSSIPLFRTVSLDRTYYRPISVEDYQRLSRQVPSEFRFVVKAPRELLVPGPEGFDINLFIERFVEPTVEGLGEKLGVVLLQFPPGTRVEHGADFVPQLARFLAQLPKGIFYSLEIRDEELLSRELHTALKETSCGLCASIHPRLPGPDKQLLAVPPTPRIPIVFRWNLRPSLDYQEAKSRFRPFSSLQLEDPVRRSVLARLVRRALEAERTVYLTVNNKAEGCAPLSILSFLEELSSVKP